MLDPSLQDYPLWEELQTHLESSASNILENDSQIIFSYTEGTLQLDSKLFPKVSCDFLNKKYLTEVKQSYGRSEGVYSFLPKKDKIRICDLTVGMGKDFFKFVLAGHEVEGFERNPIFYHMVLNGIERFKNSAEAQLLMNLFNIEEFKVKLFFGEARSNENASYDVVYYDPMFEDTSKKAAPKKGMQALKELVPLARGEEKFKTIKAWKPLAKKLVYKCSGKPKDFPFLVHKETKGKGFSYLTL